MSQKRTRSRRIPMAETRSRPDRPERPISRAGDGIGATGTDPLHESSCMESLRSRLMAVARRQLENRDDCEDACQETLLRTWRAVSEGKCPPGAIAPYAFGTFRNVVRELRRAAGRDLRWHGSDSPDPAPDPSSRLSSNDVTETVRTALEELPQDQQRVIVLTLMEDVSCSEVARREGTAPATIRQRKARARKALIEQLQTLKAG